MPGRTSAFLVVLTLVGVSFVANAQSAPIGVEGDSGQGQKGLPFRGSLLTYDHSATAYSFDQSAELHYNPTWAHRLGILPEWHFNDLFFARGKLWLGQELTQSDTTTYKNEIELSDLWLDFGTTGWLEKHSGIRVSGEVRFTLPTSKPSQALGRVMTIGPMAALSRKFNLLHGLTVAYSGRVTYRFNRFANGQFESPSIADCGDPTGTACLDFRSSGERSVEWDVMHGPAISFQPIENVSIDALFLWDHAFLYPLAPAPAQFAGSQGLAVAGTDVRNLGIFYLSASYQVTKLVGLTLGAYTLTAEPYLDGTYLNPIFNRYTTLYLEADFDVEAAAERFF